MTNSPVLLVMCLAVVVTITTVMADCNVCIYIPYDEVHHVDDESLDTTMSTIIVTKEAVRNFKCTKSEWDVQAIIKILTTVVKTKQMRIEIAFGGQYYEFETITNVELINFQNGLRLSNGSTADFKFTYSLDTDQSQWFPCVFAANHFGFRKSDKYEILLTTTQDVIDELLTPSTQRIVMRAVDTNGNAYENYPDYVIKGLEKRSAKIVHGDIKSYILAYSSFHQVATT